MVKLYLFEYYNVLPFFDEGPAGEENVITRTYNTLVETLNSRHALPRFLVIALDKDIIADVDVFDWDADILIETAVNWLVKKIELVIRRKRSDLLEKKPGGIYTGDPKIIFIRMVRQVEDYGNSTAQVIFDLRSRFNDLLNNAVVRIDEGKMMTINSCNTPNHFDVKGNMSQSGKKSYWTKVDDLLERFDKGGVKLLPNPLTARRNRNKTRFNHQQHNHYY